MAASAYIDKDYLAQLGSMPRSRLDLAETREPGIVLSQIKAFSSSANSYLTKRYTAPWPDDQCPEVVKMHIAAQVSFRLTVFLGGFDPSSSVDQTIQNLSDAADKYIREAADAEKGFPELPRRADDPSTSAITKGGALAFSEPSPFSWMDTQADEAWGRR